MLCFVVLTNILLLTSLIAILSQSLTKVSDPAAGAKNVPPNFWRAVRAFSAAMS